MVRKFARHNSRSIISFRICCRSFVGSKNSPRKINDHNEMKLYLRIITIIMSSRWSNRVAAVQSIENERHCIECVSHWLSSPRLHQISFTFHASHRRRRLLERLRVLCPYAHCYFPERKMKRKSTRCDRAVRPTYSAIFIYILGLVVFRVAVRFALLLFWFFICLRDDPLFDSISVGSAFDKTFN